MNTMNQPSLAALQRSRTTIPGAKEVLWAPLYDSFTYPAAGITGGVRLFQNQVGNGRTREDTNMQINGQLPAGWHFLAKGVEILFYPGLLPSRVGQDNTLPAGRANFTNDCYTFFQRGALILEISDKRLINESPLGVFPAQSGLAADFALSDTTSPGAARLSVADYAVNRGAAYRTQDITIFNGYNFNVQIDYPNGAAPLPSGQPARVYVRLLGYLYRNA